MNYADYELDKTPFKGMTQEEAGKKYELELAKEYNIDIHILYDKICNLNNSDAISLDNDATYLLYLFFTKEELKKMDPEFAIKWLQDFKYFLGYRKYDKNDIIHNITDAIQIHDKTRVLYLEDNDQVWNISKEESPDSWV